MGGTDLFVQIFNMGLKASVVILAVLLVRGVLLHLIPRKYVYWLWLIVGIRLLCPVVAASPVSLFHLQELAGFHSLIPDMLSREGTPDGMERASCAEEPEGQNIPLKEEKTNAQVTEGEKANTGVKVDPDMKIAEKGSGGEALSDNPGMSWWESIFSGTISPAIWQHLSVVWLGGIVCFLLWNLILAIKMKRRVSRGVWYRDNIYESDSIATPFVMGMICPRIYIPFRLGEEERQYILRHEQYHIHRRDYLIKPLAFLVTLAYWFHPLVWIAYLCMVQDMEMSCDEYVLSSMDRDVRRDYSRSLLGFAVNRRNISMNLTAFGETNTRRRVKNIMKYKKRGKWAGIVAVIVLLAVGAVCLTDAGKEPEGKQLPGQENPADSGEGISEKDQKESSAEEVPEESLEEEVTQSDQVKLGIYTPDSTGSQAKYYTPQGAEQRELQKLARKLDAAHNCFKKERKQWANAREMGYEIYYAGGYWQVFSGGYLWLVGKGDEYIGDEKTQETLIHLPELCRLSERIVREKLNYAAIDLKELHDISSAFLVYRTRKGVQNKQKITDSKSLKTLEKIFSGAVYTPGGSGCPYGNGILSLYRKDGQRIVLSLATDDCEMFRINGIYYDYEGRKTFQNGKKLKKIFDRIPIGQ